MAIKDNWTADEWNEFERLDQPAGWVPPRLKKAEADLRSSLKTMGYELTDIPRTEKKITKGRIKRTTVKRPDLGVTFASLTEERFYEDLVKQPEARHIDIHPIFTLPGGIRYHADFAVYQHGTEHHPRRARVIDVKGRKTLTTAFKRIRRLFDAHHPLAPLRVVVWDRQSKQWEEIE